MGALPINKFVTQLSQTKPHRLIVFSIGNPTAQLAHTRHNAGHLVLDHLIKSMGGLSKNPQDIFINKHVYMAPLVEHPNIYMARSLEYMNSSGKAVASVMGKIQHSPHRMFVIHDDIDTQPGMVKFKLESRAMGAHGGLNSISKHFPHGWARMRIGIGHPESRAPGVVASYVLKKFTRQEMDQLREEIFPQCLDMLQRMAKAMVPKKVKHVKGFKHVWGIPPALNMLAHIQRPARPWARAADPMQADKSGESGDKSGAQ